MLREKNEAEAQRATKHSQQIAYRRGGRGPFLLPSPQASNGKIENALGAQLGLGDSAAGRDEGDAP